LAARRSADRAWALSSRLKRFGAPKAIDDFRGHRLVDFDRSWAHIAPKPWQKSGGRAATVVFRSNSPHARLAAASAGLGLVLLPELMARSSPELCLVLPSDVVGTLAVTSPAQKKRPRAAAFR
jgi:DNA-binding transcriptional LysR family regulator